MLVKITFAYDGTGFRGWARQPGERTVEGILSAALASVYPAVGPLSVGGRTDAGVHALANVVSVEVSGGGPAPPAAPGLPPPPPPGRALANVVSVEVSGGPPAHRAVQALNASLPRDVAVIALEQAEPGFNARF